MAGQSLKMKNVRASPKLTPFTPFTWFPRQNRENLKKVQPNAMMGTLMQKAATLF